MKHSEQTFISHDNTEIYYQSWQPKLKKDINKHKAIIMFHRGHEHSERMKHIVEELELKDYHFFAWDARGHGKTSGDRGYAPNVAHVVKDIDTFIKHISLTYSIPIENMIVLGQSVGAVTLSTWLHDYAPKVKGAVLASPAFKVKLYVPLAIPSLRLLKAFSSKEKYVNSYVKGALLSHDPLRINEYNNDPTITRPISVGMLIDLFDTAKRIVEDSYAIEQPVLMLTSGNDFVVEKEPQYEFFAKLPNKNKEMYELPDFYHDTLGEQNRELAYQHIRQFIKKIETVEKRNNVEQYNEPYHFSQLEVKSLSRKSNKLEEKFFDFQKKALKFGSQFSQALKVGEDTGYDSGSSLDYVYNNVSTSDNLFGNMIDKVYLNAIGWKGIRVRRENLQKAFQYAYKKLQDKQYPLTSKKMKKQVAHQLRFVDIAAGHGRYDIDFLKNLEGDFRATLSDYSEINIKEGYSLIQDNHLESKVSFVQGDAFNTNYVKNLTENANMVVVSGLYELYPNNDLIENSLAGISAGIESGGYLIYTNQPWHPQLKFIAKVLSSHRKGEDWVMRRRTQAEMDTLVEKHGFTKVEQFIDQYGIFTVSVAIKI